MKIPIVYRPFQKKTFKYKGFVILFMIPLHTEYPCYTFLCPLVTSLFFQSIDTLKLKLLFSDNLCMSGFLNKSRFFIEILSVLDDLRQGVDQGLCEQANVQIHLQQPEPWSGVCRGYCHHLQDERCQ